ncbi:PAS domain-containing sensor histidine kinase [Paenibacillus alginolyticus]|uniref:histidine kinase n=2 Tax=Paenibacillus alginolyticus TaxID=59839 RepID=A0ABT4GL99_9BACL|nr:PAS domain-containing sensor histidine kinase [Paenibacillus alginolyticus]MCY9696813.1 PAS domain S-box protein [Paenibacillus alginolyticus]MEC0147673.1 PAS domain S-box protein [Paenibacillus alginolyticus]
MKLKEHLIDSFMNLTSDGIVIVDVNGKVLEVNKKFEELHGWTREEVIGKVLPMTPDKYKEDALRLYQSLIDGEQSSDFEALKLRKDGSTFYANVTVSPMKDSDGVVIGFIGVERDISEKKRADEELLERERQFRRLIKLNPEPIALHNDGLIQFVNDACCSLFGGVSSDDFKGKRIYDFFCLSAKDFILERLQYVMQSDSYTDFMEIKLRKLDGTFFDAEISSIYVHKNMGVPVVQTVIRDLTERKKSEEALIRSEKLSLIGQLAAGIAHDIRNPLTSLKGFVKLLKAKNADYVDVMLEELEHINYVVNEFMMLAKPHLNCYMESTSLGLVKSVVGFLQPHAHLYNVQIHIDIDPDIPAIYCNPDQIKQVLINILKNGIESMPNGGIIQIAIRNATNQGVLIRIEDQGIGISGERLSQLGEPFYTTKVNGTGLGLMVCKRIIEGHGGKLLIQSKINEGTTVEIELPKNEKPTQPH